MTHVLILSFKVDSSLALDRSKPVPTHHIIRLKQGHCALSLGGKTLRNGIPWLPEIGDNPLTAGEVPSTVKFLQLTQFRVVI
jgi:hypothetical protein